MAQSTTPATPGVPAPMSSTWPPSGAVIPFPLPWGQTGCCPPGGMDALMKCYCDIQAASAFIGQIMIDQINNNPAVAEAIIAALEKSGSTLPLIGVTDGSNAQPGQVGEYIQLSEVLTITGAANNLQQLTLGVLQPGDWDCWAYITGFSVNFNGMGFQQLNPVGFSWPLAGYDLIEGGPALDAIILSFAVRASLTVPTLIAFNVETNLTAAGTPGTGTMFFAARRMR